MDRSKRFHSARLHSAVLTLLALGLLTLAYWLSQRSAVEMDWTYGHRSSLSAETLAVLRDLDGAVSVTVFVRDGDDAAALRRRISMRFEQYSGIKPDLTVTFVNPDLQPDLARALAISRQGEMVVRMGERSERLQALNEQAVTNALYRLARRGTKQVWITTGHGERDMKATAGYQLSSFSEQLRRRGFAVDTLRIDGNTAPPGDGILIIASPSSEFAEHELAQLLAYLDQGGSLLWLADPGAPESLGTFAEALGLTLLPGLVVDASTRSRGIDNPTFVLGNPMASHVVNQPISKDTPALFPRATGIDAEAAEGWDATALIGTTQDSWTETGAVSGQVQYDAGGAERPGPITLIVALTRPAGAGTAEQRVIVAGDGDFLTNAYLGVGANLPLGLAMLSWLATDDASISIPTRPAPDTRIDLSDRQIALLGLLFLILSPLALAITGATVLWRRRRRR